ncbi:MAG: hypothetical protein ACI85O_003884 [Saprospiraceae bacterium]|jgi:hypothetical protein
MSKEYIEIDLDNTQKAAILKYADFFITDTISKKDLVNKRKKWIRFTPYALSQIIGELSHYFNKTNSDSTFHLLDELICHLEFYEK